ncbi:hypothetical protein [Gryllotalpicola koreensis]|uniref:DUF5047 domain-containing protein n=1 Tax=Gryllotalpicola koreensis TaxID=993086 RepID=A0ABP8A1N6_9MICO
MRSGSAELRDVLKGSFDCWWQADVFLDGERVYQNLPVLSVSTNENATSGIQYTGSLTVAYQADDGRSISPVQMQDALSPFGSQIALYLCVSSGPFLERVLLGNYLISSLPQANTTWGIVNGVQYAKGDLLQVQFSDLFWRTQKNQFDQPSAPASLASVWGEIQRLTLLPVTKNIADSAIPSSVAYQTNRLDAVYSLATVLDATAYITPDGTVSMRPNLWPVAADDITGGDLGTLISAPRSMDPSIVYNAIVVRDVAGNVLASQSVTDGPLRAANSDGSLSPYGRVPYYYSSPFVTTTAQASAYIAKNLPRVSTLRGQQRTITESINPLRDLGDVVNVTRIASGVSVEAFQGRVQSIQRSGKTQTLTVQVSQ